MTPYTPGPDARGWRNRPLVRETDERGVRSLWKAFLAVLVAIAPTAVYLVQQNQCVKLAYEVSDLELTYEELVKQELDLQAETAGLETLDGIERWALRKHGLERPGAENVVIVRVEPERPADLMARRAGGTTGGTPR